MEAGAGAAPRTRKPGQPAHAESTRGGGSFPDVRGGNTSGPQMARFARIDSQIRANHLIVANRSGFLLNPFFANRVLGGLKIANGSFEAIRANRSHVMKLGVFLGGRLMHHQNVSLQNAPSKRTLLTSLKRSKAGSPQLKRSKKYVLMVHFAVIRFDGASGARQFSANRFARIDSRESPRFALRIAGPSKFGTHPC